MQDDDKWNEKQEKKKKMKGEIGENMGVRSRSRARRRACPMFGGWTGNDQVVRLAGGMASRWKRWGLEEHPEQFKKDTADENDEEDGWDEVSLCRSIW